MHGSALCAIFGFDLSNCSSCVLVSGLHLVVMPKSDDPSKAVLSTCTEAELIKLAAKDMLQGQYSMPVIYHLRPVNLPCHHHRHLLHHMLSFSLCACFDILKLSSRTLKGRKKKSEVKKKEKNERPKKKRKKKHNHLTPLREKKD